MTELFEKRPATGGDYEPLGAAKLLDHGDWGVRLRAGSTTVEVSALAPNLFRVGAFPQGRTPRYDSEAIAKSAWEPVEVSMLESEEEITLSTPEATAHIDLEPLRIRFTDEAGREFAADDPDLGMGFVTGRKQSVVTTPLGEPARLYKRRESGERYFGCGERTSGLEKTGSYQVFWNVDPPAGHTAAFENLYTSIPFTLSMVAGKAHGLFFDNTHRVEFDLAKEDAGRAYYGAEGGDIVYYAFSGPTPREVLDRYTELTGRTPMPPMWSLGNQQCRWSYETDDEVRELAREFRDRDIPCDVIFLDIDYMDGYRVFTWDKDRFPEPAKLISDLREQGFRVVTIVDPGVKTDEDYPVYVEGRARDLYCKTQEGEEFHNVVWPGMCAFPDFTNPETREWWGENHEVLTEAGVAGIWNDMNEPSLFVPQQSTMPGDVVHPGGGDPKWHAQIHNTYGSLMARATREGLLKLNPDERPMVITRAGYAGLQRHAMQWTGDNSSWWEHLWMSMPQLQNLGLSGVGWAGVDIGGFFGDSNGELLARFTEFGVFQPFCRNHSAKGTIHQEPWSFGEPYESVCRKMIKLRMRLLPYLYTLFDECHRTGAPILRPLLFEYPEDETTYTMDDEFLFGGDLLVAPITRPGIEHRHVYLPGGTWFHYWTGERFDGPAHILAHAPLGEPPLYVKANKAVAMGAEISHTGEASDPLSLLLYPSEGAAESTLYEDAGNGFGYEEGEYARRSVACEVLSGDIAVRIGAREGSFVPERESAHLELRGVNTRPESVLVNGEEADWGYEEAGGNITVRLAETADEVSVEVRVTGPDLDPSS
ncbi:MAG TPA: glycoside hydrolase family 31 protein [Rubrobacteraceae bacterium]|nr:glycoside hydrolase family 31 protein [Rubrobacteraceae bacterium]